MQFINLFVFVMGLVWGSFLNVVVYRSSHGKSFVTGRSICPNCKKVIPWKYNVPILSFIFLQGKCAFCKKKISWQYPLIETMTGLLFLWWFMIGKSFFQLTGNSYAVIQPIFWLVVGMIFLVIFMTDMLYGLIPDSVNLFFLTVVLFYRVFLVSVGIMDPKDFVVSIITSVIIGGFFLFLVWITKGKGMGWGDVKLSPILALLLGWPKALVALFCAFVVGAIVGLVLIAFKKKKMKQTIPFGPFLITGAMIALVWGNQIWSWYVGMLQ